MMPTCPHCGNTTPDVCGREVPGVYDGVLFWTCDKCLRAWSRDWTGFGRRQELADTYVQQWNDHADAAEKAAARAHHPDCPVRFFTDRPERCRCIFMSMLDKPRSKR